MKGEALKEPHWLCHLKFPYWTQLWLDVTDLAPEFIDCWAQNIALMVGNPHQLPKLCLAREETL